MTHICVSKFTIIGSDNGLSPGRHQALIWTNARILLIGPLGTNFNDIFYEIHTFSFKKIHLKMSSGKWRPFCLGLNVLMTHVQISGWWKIFHLELTNYSFTITVYLRLSPRGQSSVVGGLKWWLSRGCKRPFHREVQIWVKQYLA